MQNSYDVENNPILILHVDDDPFQLAIFEEFLNEALNNLSVSAQLVNATSKDEGLNKFHDHDFAVIITDLDMPDQNDGIDMIKFIRREPIRSDKRKPPFIIVRSSRSSDERKAIQAAGGNGIIVKGDPGEVALLESLIREALEKRQFSKPSISAEPDEHG